MKVSSPFGSSFLLGCSVVLLGALPVAHANQASKGRWIGPKNGGWGASANWVDGAIPGGVDATATFEVDASDTIYVGVDTARTVGHLVLKGRRPFELSGSRLTLAVGGLDEQPTITVLDGHHLLPCGLAGSQGFVKRGGSHLYLTGESSYGGTTFISAGHVYASNPRSLGLVGPDNNTVVGHTAQLHLSRSVRLEEDVVLFRTAPGASNNLYSDNGDNILAGSLTIQRGGTSAQAYLVGVQVSDGTLLISGPVTGKLTPDATPGAAGMDANVLRIRVRSGAEGEVSGVVSDGDIGPGGLSLQKTDAGLLRLTAANRYSGSTVVEAGRLQVDNRQGSGTGSGAVSIDAGAVLGGIGTLAPEGRNGITLATGATLAPGPVRPIDNPAEVRKLTFALGATEGHVTLQSGAKLAIRLDPRLPGGVMPAVFTGLARGGARVFFNDNVVDFSLAPGATLKPGAYMVARFDAPDAYAGRLVLGAGLEAYDATLEHGPESIQLRVNGRR